MSSLRPVVVLGAARSGTKIMRDGLAVAAAAGVVPYDVGYIWRYGNERRPDDCLIPADAKPRTRRLVRNFVGRYANSDGLVVEKTVGNTLRVPFIAELMPEASYVYLERDGVDVALSARREWQAPADLRYLLGKARHFPLRIAPSYGAKFTLAQTLGRWHSDGHVGTWGPRYPGIDNDLVTDGLLRVCARQWRASVTSVRRDIPRLGGTVVRVTYEDLLADPAETLERVLEELNLPVVASRLGMAASMVHPKEASSTRSRLDVSERLALREELGELLEELGYDQP